MRQPWTGGSGKQSRGRCPWERQPSAVLGSVLSPCFLCPQLGAPRFPGAVTSQVQKASRCVRGRLGPSPPASSGAQLLGASGLGFYTSVTRRLCRWEPRECAHFSFECRLSNCVAWGPPSHPLPKDALILHTPRAVAQLRGTPLGLEVGGLAGGRGKADPKRDVG